MYRIQWDHEKNVYVLYRDNIECGIVTSEVVSKELAILFDEHKSPSGFLERFVELEDMIAYLESDLEEKQEEMEEQHEELNEEILRLEEKVEDLKIEKKELVEEIEKLKKENLRETMDAEQSHEDVRELEETVDKLYKEIEELKRAHKVIETIGRINK